MQVCTFVRTHQTVHIKGVQSIMHKNSNSPGLSVAGRFWTEFGMELYVLDSEVFIEI